MTIRSHLLALALGVVLPVFSFAVLVTLVVLQREQNVFARGTIERLRSTMNAIDAQVHGQIRVLNALAASEALEQGDIATFHRQALRVLRSQPSWLNIILASPEGELLDNAALPGAAGQRPDLAEGSPTRRAAATRSPAVGSVVQGSAAGKRGVDLAVPVIYDDQVRYVLLVFVNSDFYLTPIKKQRIHEGWVSGLVDADGMFIARVPPPPNPRAGADFLRAVRRGSEGWYRGPTVEGLDTYTAYISSPFTQWSIGLGVPADEVLASVRRTAWLLGAGIIASIALASFLALRLGRRVSRPVAAVARAVPAVAAGRPIEIGGLEQVNEVRTVALALNQAAAAVREREELLEREKQALREADRAKDEFIAMMSHELRNPIAALSTASALLELDPDRDTARHAGGVIKRQTRHMARMIEDLLDVSRIAMGKTYLRPEIFDLGEAASVVVDTWRSLDRFQRDQVRVHAESVWIRADRSRVEQILSNLLDNALKFGPPDTCVTVSVGKEGPNAVLEVSDSGPGLSHEMMRAAFDLFVQGEQSLARRSGGMGLGLALVKRLTELQGGTVSVRSEEGSGATFSVSFPAVAEPRAIASPARRKPTENAGRLLLIEDNDDVRKTLSALLRLKGCEVYEAPDGTTGVELARKVQPEVAIVDIGLPDIDGYEVAKRLRLEAAIPRTTLVALTGYGQNEDKQRALACGFDAHLTKPVALEDLEAVISFTAAHRAQGEASAS